MRITNYHVQTNPWLLFMLGVFSLTEIRIVGSIAISELIIFIVAPFIFLKDISHLRRDGFMTLILLSFAVMLSNVISCMINHVQIDFALRGIAANYSIFAIPVVMHYLLRRNLNGVKWVLLGMAVSSFLTIFIFQKATDIGAALRTGESVTDTILANDYLWNARIAGWLKTPINAFYFQTPTFYNVLLPLLFSLYFLCVSASGRAAALTLLFGSILIFIGQKRRSRMSVIGKNFGKMVFIGIIVLFALKTGYVYAVRSGMLGDKALKKFELQTGGNDSAKAIIMGGRTDFFMGVAAAIRKPLFGYGPWPIDKEGIAEDFLHKHGSYQEIVNYENIKKMASKNGMLGYRWIPTHSHLIGFWVWYGLAGLVFWIYVLWLIFKVVKIGLSAIPQWYGYFALTIPSFLWAIFFSPYSGRIGTMTFVVCLLFAKAVAEKKLMLPYEMEVEALRHDSR